MNFKWFKIIFLIVLIVRVLIATLMWPGNDEAYYYVYTLHPALSYFDHPPMVALAGGLIPAIFNWVSPLSIRLGPIILFSVTIYLFFLLSNLYFNKKEALFSAVVFMVIPMFFFAGTLLLPDAPLLLFWVLGIYLFKIILDKPTLTNWLLLGITAGFGMLSKYTMGFLFLGIFFYLLLYKKDRKLLLSKGPYLAVLVSIIIFLPVLIWNINNNFISFTFQAGRVGFADINFRHFYQSFFGQMGYLLPFFFFPALYYSVKSIFNFKRNILSRFIFCFGAIPVFFFIFAALFRRVLPHWPIIGYVTLALPVGSFYYKLFLKKKKIFNLFAFLHVFLLVSLISVALIQIHTGILMNRRVGDDGIQKREKVRDITIDIIGWDKLAEYINKYFADKDIFLFTHRWELGGHISFAVKGKFPVLILEDINRARGFAFWQNIEEQIGKDGLFISTSRFFFDPRQKYMQYFDNIELIKEIPIIRSGVTVKIIYIFKCENFNGTSYRPQEVL